ncbi:hypothetical protein TrST_g4947 [Triparma strigata]|uniref:Uncharacterized protein n=1 Tax=Triparma strigata TaxID=1606541 RepID=A0A9W7ET22_9STRA|nr:hypothetical protein TrST_g4947 [Triparma strigata]
MVVTVAEDGNRRVGGMTDAEAQQCVRDIIAWFKRSSDLEISEGSEESMQPLIKSLDGEVPETLSYMVSQCNNEIWYGDKKGLTAEKIMDFVSDGKFGEGNLPIASDEDEEWFIVLETETGEVKEWEEDDGLGDSLGGSYNDYLEEYRNSLLAGKFEYVEDCGCMEKAGAGGGNRK